VLRQRGAEFVYEGRAGKPIQVRGVKIVMKSRQRDFARANGSAWLLLRL
jgi:hypothetical protein